MSSLRQHEKRHSCQRNKGENDIFRVLLVVHTKLMGKLFQSMIISIDTAMSEIKSHDFDEASNMLGPERVVVSQMFRECPSALHSNYPCNSLNLSAASVRNVSRSMQCMMDACVEINRLIKCSPKREKFLGEVTIFYYV